MKRYTFLIKGKFTCESKGGVRIFGYLRPFNNELKVKYVNEYKLEYCTLCHGLKMNFGLFSTPLLNYECTFLYIFLTALYPELNTEEETFRCPINPAKKQQAYINRDALEYASFVNYHLALLKVYDGCTDSKWLKKLIFKFIFWIMSRNKKYALLRSKFAEMAQNTDNSCKELYRLEAAGCNDYDLCSAAMGNVLYEIMNFYLQEHPVENIGSILSFAKHLGMWTYLIDAYDDFEDDQKSGSFNPLNAFAVRSGSEASSQLCLRSGEIMLGMMTANLSALHKSIIFYRHNEIIENIVSYGTRSAVQTIKKKRVKKKNDCNCKK